MRAPLESAENSARDLARLIKDKMPVGWGFMLCLFSHGDKEYSTYLSSLERTSMIKALRELADSLEQNKKNT